MLSMQVNGFISMICSVSYLCRDFDVKVCFFQKFAYDKMEWPKHYTSEKVLVLMTYAELMNRKYGREISSQIKALR